MKTLCTISFCLLTAFSAQADNKNYTNIDINNFAIFQAEPPVILVQENYEFANLPEGLTIDYKVAKLQTSNARIQKTIHPLIDAYVLYLLDIDANDIPSAIQNHIIKKHKAGSKKHVHISTELLYTSDEILSLAIYAYILNEDQNKPNKPYAWIINYDMREFNLLQRKNLFKVSESQVLKHIEKLFQEGLVFDEKGDKALALNKTLALPEQVGFIEDKVYLLYQPTELSNESIKYYISRVHMKDILIHK